jgi:hypothetical protein
MAPKGLAHGVECALGIVLAAGEVVLEDAGEVAFAEGGGVLCGRYLA